MRDPEWSTFDDRQRNAVLEQAFKESIEPDPDYKGMDPDQQSRVRAQYFLEAGETQKELEIEQAPESRGFLGRAGSALARGAVEGIIKPVGSALEMLDTTPREVDKEEGVLDTAGRAITDWSDKVLREYDFLKKDKGELRGEPGFVERGLIGIPENIPGSLPVMGAAYAGFKGGAAIGGLVGGPAGAAVGGTIGTVAGSLFGLVAFFGPKTYTDEFSSAYQELKTKRPEATEEEIQEVAHRMAFKSAAFEVGTEIPGTLLALRMLGGTKVLTQPFKATMRNVLTKPPAELAKEFALATAGEVGGEMVASGGQAYVRQEEGLSGPTVPQAVAESVIPALGMSLFFGAAAAGYNAAQTRSTMQALNSPDQGARLEEATKMALRIKANTQDTDLAVAWYNKALETIQKNEPFAFDQKLVEFAQFKTVQDFKEPELPKVSPEEYKPIVVAADAEEALGAFKALTDLTENEKKLQELKAQADTGGPTLQDLASMPQEQAKKLLEEPLPQPEPLRSGQQIDYTTDKGSFRALLLEQKDEKSWEAMRLDNGTRFTAKADKVAPAAILEEGRKIQYKTVKGLRNAELVSPLGDTAWNAKWESGEPFIALKEKITALPIEGEKLEEKYAGTLYGDQRQPLSEAGRGLEEGQQGEENVQGYQGQAVRRLADTGGQDLQRLAEGGGETGGPVRLEVDRIANESATSERNALTQPTDDQKRVGNYPKAHLKGDLINLSGLDITIENPEGSTRTEAKPKDATADWKPGWSSQMKNAHYGYFRRTEGKDGDQIDVFIGPNPEAKTAFIVDQVDPKTGKFDEHKTLVGYDSEVQAREAYLSNYEPGWKGLGAITEVPIENFKEWVGDGKKKKEPISLGKEAPTLPEPVKQEIAWKQRKSMGMTFHTTPLENDTLVIRENPTKGKNKFIVYKKSEGEKKNIGKFPTLEEAKAAGETIIPRVEPVAAEQPSARMAQEPPAAGMPEKMPAAAPVAKEGAGTTVLLPGKEIVVPGANLEAKTAYEEGRQSRIDTGDEYRLSKVEPREMEVYKKENPQLRENPKTVKIYRATGGPAINAGDWVYLREDLAKKHQETRPGAKIVEMEVPLDDIVTASDAVEFVYSPRETQKSVETPKTLVSEARKFKSSEELLRAGGFSAEALDRAAFGFSAEDVKTLEPREITIKYREDRDNAIAEAEKSGQTPEAWAATVDLTEPVQVSYEGGKFMLEDGHHRYLAAKLLNKPLNVDLTIKDKPIEKLSGRKDYDYDQFVRDTHDQVNFIKTKNAYDEALKKGEVDPGAHAAILDGIDILQGHDLTERDIVIENDSKATHAIGNMPLTLDPASDKEFLLNYGYTEGELNELVRQGGKLHIRAEINHDNIRGDGSRGQLIRTYNKALASDVYEEIVHALERRGILDAGPVPEGTGREAHLEAHAKQVVQDLLAGKEVPNVRRRSQQLREETAGARKEEGVSGTRAGKQGVPGEGKGRQSYSITGAEVTEPAVSYTRGVDAKGNVWVRQSDAPTNAGRQLLLQFSTELFNFPEDAATNYYKTLYGGTREGYAKLRDFWEIPQWMGYVSKFLPDADVYIVRDMKEAKKFLETAGYDRMIFSAIDVNKDLIRELSEDFKGKVDIGGYTTDTFGDVPNATWHKTLKSLAESMGVEFVDGVDYRHFQDAEVIPRLTMSRGCKHRCAFCTVEKQLVETPTEVIDQQAEAFGLLKAKLVYLNDKTFGQAGNYKHLENVYQAILKNNHDFKGFIIQTTGASILKMDDAWLQKSGIRYVELGVETYNNALLRELHKPHNESVLDKAAEKLRKNNIKMIPNIIIGLPNETNETYDRTLAWIDKQSDIVSHMNIYNLALYEGTELAGKIEAAKPEDFDENVLEKSFHKEKGIHEEFARMVYRKGTEGLEARQFSIDKDSKEIARLLEEAKREEYLPEARDLVRTASSLAYKKYKKGDKDLFLKLSDMAYGLASQDYNLLKEEIDKILPRIQFSIDSPAFKKWFGDSKVVDKNGKPLVVYHGTRGVFDAFDMSRAEDLPQGGAYFTNKRTIAETYGGDQRKVMEVYLSIKRPYNMTAWQWYGNPDWEYDSLIEDGHDGIIVTGPVHEHLPGVKGEKMYIAFSPTQIKSVNNLGTWNPEDARIQYAIGKSKRSLGARILAGEMPKPVGKLVTQIASYLSNESAKEGVIDHRTATPKQNKAVEKALIDMLDASLQKAPESLTWYREDLGKMMEYMMMVHPELTDPEHKFNFTLALAITSQGNNTTKNVEFADQAYKTWKKNGKLAVPIAAKDGAIIYENLKFSDLLASKFKDWKEYEDWLMGSAPLRDVIQDVENRLGITTDEAKLLIGTHELMSEVVPRAVVFGPKLGAFFLNLNGDFSPVTMDMWFMRTFGRIQGNLLEGGSPEEDAAERARLKAAIKKSPRGVRLAGLQPGLFGYDDAFIDEAAKKIARLVGPGGEAFRNKLNSLNGGDELRLAANAREKHLQGSSTKDTPDSGEHRRWLRERINNVRETLSKKGKTYENADIQAAIWIGEKEIYHAFGSKQQLGDYFSKGAETLYHGTLGRVPKGPAKAAGRGAGGAEQSTFFSISAAEKIYELAKANPRGFTINISDGTLVTKGWAVSPTKLTETVVGAFTPQDVDNFLEKFKHVFEKNKNAFFGGWFDNDQKSSNYGNFVLDVSFVVDNFADAAYIGEAGGQDGIANLEDPKNGYVRVEDAISRLREGGLYDEGRRAELGRFQAEVHRSVQQRGPVLQRSVGREVPEGHAREGSVSGVGVHYSFKKLTRLDPRLAGTGPLRGAERARLLPGYPNAKRAYIYIHEGKGITPETGLGPFAHKVSFTNFYEADYDPLKIISSIKTLNDFEQKIMKLGYNGIVLRDQGMAVFLGDQEIPVESIDDVAGIPALPEYSFVLTPGKQYSIQTTLGQNPAPIDDVAPTLLNVKRPTPEIVSEAQKIYNSWPDQVTASDGMIFTPKNPEGGRHSTRVWHLLRQEVGNGFDVQKARWLPNVIPTVENASRVLEDPSGTKIYVRAYKDGTRHMVVSTNGALVTHGALLTQFPKVPGKARQDLFNLLFTREATPAGTPPVAAASMVAGPKQSGIPNTVTPIPEPKPDVKTNFSIGKPVAFTETLGAVTNQDYELFRSEGRREAMLSGAKKGKETFYSEVSKLLAPISTRLKNIDEGLAFKLRQLDMTTNKDIQEDARKVLPLLMKVRKTMTPEDRKDWAYARTNSDSPVINELVDKYDMRKEYEAVREVFGRIRDAAIDVGLDIGEIEDYWTRKVIDYQGLLEEMGAEEKGIFTKAIEKKAADLGIQPHEIDEDMRATLATNVILGGPPGLGGVSATKQRVFRKVPPRLMKYYMDPDAALMYHIHQMWGAIEKRRFFGKIPDKVAETRRQLYAAQARVREWEQKVRTATDEEISRARRKLHEWDGEVRLLEGQIWKYSLQRDYTDNIGAYVDELVTEKQISAGQQAEVAEILKARFEEKGAHGFWQLYKDLSYIDTMGSPISALTQIGDLTWAFYEAGLIKGVKHAFLAATGQAKITRADLGIDKISEEFADASAVAKAVGWVFKAVGLDKMDAIGKEALLNAALEKYQTEARENPAAMTARLQRTFGEEAEATVAALQNGEITDNVKMLVYSRLADFQPVGLSEMPQRYLTSGNGRLFYMLKTFTIKQFDAFRNEAIHKITSGTRSEKIEGLKNLIRLAMFFVLANATADELKDFILGRKTDFSDRVTDNVLRLAGSSKFVTWKARTEGVGSALARQILPPFKFIDSVTKDVYNAGDDKGLELTASIPLLGKLAYWHLGRGTTKRDDVWDLRWRKFKAPLAEANENYEKARDKAAFMSENREEMVAYHKANRFQARLNSFRKIINQLKSREQTDSTKKRIRQLEERRTELIKQYLEKEK